MPITASILGLGAVQAGIGIGDVIAGNNIDVTRPELTTPEPYKANQKLAASEAQYGLNPDALQSLQTGAEQGLTASLGTLQDVGGNPNQVSDVFMNYITTLGKNAVYDSQLKNQKVQDLYSANTTLGDFDVTKFLYNKDAPFKDEMQRKNELLKSGKQEIFGGLDTAVSGFAQGKDQKGNDKLIEQLLELLA